MSVLVDEEAQTCGKQRPSPTLSISSRSAKQSIHDLHVGKGKYQQPSSTVRVDCIYGRPSKREIHLESINT
jgi:hypothetical protein